MSVRLRLARGGTKKRPYYRLVAAERTRPRDGKFLERIGSYNPLLKNNDPMRVVIDKERAKYWLSVGAEPSARVAIFLAQAGLMAPLQKTKQTKQHLPRAKTLAKLEEAEKLAAAKKEAEKVAAETAKKELVAESAKPVEAAEARTEGAVDGEKTAAQ